MLRHELLKDKGVLVLHPEGALQSSDFERIGKEVDPWIEKNGKLAGVMVEAVKFPGWDDFASMVSHLRFVRDHQRNVKRIAMVSDSALLNVGPRIARHFVSAEVKTFPAAERGQALEWIETGG
jgi:hypothetical protein